MPEVPIKYGCSQHANRAAYTELSRGAYIEPTADGRILWHIINYTPDTDERKTLDAFAAAIAIWQPAFPDSIILTPTSDEAEAHIKLLFLREDDPRYGTYFDGENGVLAVAYAPVEDEPLRGFIFMDEGENWAEMHTPNTKDLLTVILHELGHTFNLGHEASVPEAIMYPSYTGEKRAIAADDIAGIQALYGRFDTSTPRSGCLGVLLPFLPFIAG